MTRLMAHSSWQRPWIAARAPLISVLLQQILAQLLALPVLELQVV